MNSGKPIPVVALRVHRLQFVCIARDLSLSLLPAACSAQYKHATAFHGVDARSFPVRKGKLEVKMENKYEDYFQKHPDFYDADWKKAVFLTGVLAQHVMDIQWQERNARPFRSRLSGLKLDARAIKRLLPESIEKLEQYKKNYYRKLEETIALLMESGEPELKTQSVDQISFYFAVGMNMNKKFKTKEIEGEKNE